MSVRVCMCVCVMLPDLPHRQEAHIAEREEAWSEVEKMAIQSRHYKILARPEAITAKMVFPRLEPMSKTPQIPTLLCLLWCQDVELITPRPPLRSTLPPFSHSL